MLIVIHHKPVIYLIRKNHELVLSCHINYLLQHLPWIERSRRVIRVYYYDCLCLVCNLLFDILYVRIPL